MKLPYSVQVILDRLGNLKPDDIASQLRYSTYVSVSKRYLYFAVTKAGCTTVKELLRSVEGAPQLKLLVGFSRQSRRYMFVHARQNAPLPSLLDLNDQTQREVLESPDYFRFTFVRNPYTRLMSAWKEKVMLCEPDFQQVYIDIKQRLPELHGKSLISFGEFVDYISSQADPSTWNGHWRRQTDHCFLGALNYSLVGKIETMAEGLRQFERHLGLARPLVPDARNVSGSTGDEVYDQSLADKVYSLYRCDFAALGYDRTSWPRRDESRDRTEEAMVPEARFNEEVAERNTVIALLYEERDQLRADLRTASRFHLLTIANVLLVIPRLARSFGLKMSTWLRRQQRA